MFDEQPYSDFQEPTAKDMPVIMQRMLDAEPYQRSAYFEIAKDVGPSAIPFLAKLIKHPDWEVRHHAVGAIGGLLESHDSSPEVLKLFTSDSNDSVSHLAALYLARLNASTDLAVPILIRDLRELRHSIEANDYDEECTRIEIVFSLGHVSPATDEIIEEVIRSLDDPSLNVRWSAVQSLAQFGRAADKAVPRLRTILTQNAVDLPISGDEIIRSTWASLVNRLKIAAVDALFRIGNECHEETLADLLDDPSAVCFDHHQALTLLAKLPIAEKTRLVISEFLKRSNDEYANQLARAALDRNM